MIAELTCQKADCWAQARYDLMELHVCLYTHGICTVVFTCKTCPRRSEFGVPDRVAIEFDRHGVPTTIVRVPDEVFEWPEAEPPIDAFEVGLVERSSLDHFNTCVVKELYWW